MPTNPTGTFFIKTLKSTNIILILDMVYSEYLVDDNEENIDCLTVAMLYNKNLFKNRLNLCE